VESESQHFPTVGEIARRVGAPVHKVEYVIRTRGIRPCGRAGNARVFSEVDVARISSELRRIAGPHANAPDHSEGCHGRP
jgi:hypothetical protein